MPPPTSITGVLQAVRSGDRDAVDRLFETVYEELQRIARQQRWKWSGNETLNTTALVHEAYMKLVKQSEVDWKDRSHFYAVAATAMRHILINYAERRVAAKRGGGQAHVSLDAANPVAAEAAEDLVALGAATSTVERDWAVASAWLRRALDDSPGASQ